MVSLGFGPGGKRLRKAVSARTKTEVREKVRALREELAAGITPRGAYTVAEASPPGPLREPASAIGSHAGAEIGLTLSD